MSEDREQACAACGAVSPPGGLKLGHEGGGADYDWFCRRSVACAERIAAELRGEALRTPEEWMEVTGIKVHDPDGWRSPGDPHWDEPITRSDFLRRASHSTTLRWPSPLKDEA